MTISFLVSLHIAVHLIEGGCASIHELHAANAATVSSAGIRLGHEDLPQSVGGNR